jgi:hypothetical protein
MRADASTLRLISMRYKEALLSDIARWELSITRVDSEWIHQRNLGFTCHFLGEGAW